MSLKINTFTVDVVKLRIGYQIRLSFGNATFKRTWFRFTEKGARNTAMRVYSSTDSHATMSLGRNR